MTINVEAVYENGVLKPAQPLTLKEGEKVRLTIQAEGSWVDRTAGMFNFQGDPEELRRLALDELDPREEP